MERKLTSLELDLIYHSCGIEGNSLTLRETQVALEGITIGGKTAREHFEVWGHQKALDYLNQWVASGEALTEGHIKQMHAMVMFGVNETWGGVYKLDNNEILGARVATTPWAMVPHEMGLLLRWLDEHQDMEFFERIARFHYRFERIHPFADGNGRTGRLLLCRETLLAGLGLVIIPRERRLDYYNALDEAQTNIAPLRHLIVENTKK